MPSRTFWPQNSYQMTDAAVRICSGCGSPVSSRFCPQCGLSAAGLNAEAKPRKCPGCGNLVTTEFCPFCGMNAEGLTAAVDVGSDISALLRLCNVGAGLGAGFWAFGNGAPILGCIYWLSLPILPPIAIAIMVYLFINGNRVALERRRFTSLETFRKIQRTWAMLSPVAGLAALIIGLWMFASIIGISHHA